MLPNTNIIRAAKASRILVLSLVALLLAVFLVAGLYRLMNGRKKPQSLDAGPTYRKAQEYGAFPVSFPLDLPDDWRVLSSDFQTDIPDAVLRIGLRAPDGGAVQIVQSAKSSEMLLADELGDSAHAFGAVGISGRTWQRYVAERGLQALVLRETRRTIILVGTAGDKDLRGLAQSLT